MFWIRYKHYVEGVLTDTEVMLRPGPTEIDYPERRLYKAHTTQDGWIVVQRPLRDSRSRTWSWKGYPPTIPTYENQWKFLETLEYRTRLQSSLPGYVEIWEDVSGVGGFDSVDEDSARVYTKVKFLQVNRTPRKGGGTVTYDDSGIEFVIQDEQYTSF